MICPWCPPLPLGRASRRSASVRGTRDGCWQVQGQRFLGPLSFEVSTARRYVTHPYFAPPAMAEGSRIAAAEPHVCERSSGRRPRSYGASRGWLCAPGEGATFMPCAASPPAAAPLLRPLWLQVATASRVLCLAVPVPRHPRRGQGGGS